MAESSTDGDYAPRALPEPSETASMHYMDCGDTNVELPMEQEEGLASELANSRHAFSEEDEDEDFESQSDEKNVTSDREQEEYDHGDNMYNVPLGTASNRSLKSFGGSAGIASTVSSVKKQAPSPPAETVSALVSNSEAARIRDNRHPERPTHSAKEYLCSVEGFLFISEIVGAFLCWTLIAGWSHAGATYRMPCPLGFSLCFFIVSWIMSGTLLAVMAMSCDEKYRALKLLKTPVFGMVYNWLWAMLYLIGGSIAGSKAVADMTQVLAAATSFAFVVLILHVFHGLLYFRRLFGQCPWSYFEGCNKECGA